MARFRDVHAMKLMLDDTRLRYGVPLAAALGVVGLALTLHDGLSAYQASARFTGRVSLAVFAVLALLYATEAGRDAGRRLMTPFAAVHLFHFVCLATYLDRVGTWPAPARLLGGGLAYGLIVGMPLVQRFAADTSERARAVFEGFYLGWVGFIFLMSYVLRIAGKVPEAGGTRTEHLVLLGAVLATAVAHLTLRRVRT